MAVPQEQLHTLLTNTQSRSDAVVEPTIVETYKIGNTTIHICSDHFVKTEKEQEECIQKMYDIAWLIVRRAAARGVQL